MNQALEVTSVLNSITEYLKGCSLKMVLAALPFCVLCTVQPFFFCGRITKIDDIY